MSCTSTNRVRKTTGVQRQVLAVILTVTGSKGGVLLFRYPCDNSTIREQKVQDSSSSGNKQFTVKNSDGVYEVTNQFHRPFGIDMNGHLTYSDKVLSNFLTVHAPMSDKLFDVKVDDVQFVGYPVTITHSNSRIKKKGGRREGSGSTTTVNVVFALPETIGEKTKACFHQLAQQIAMALKHEEKRCCYFCNQRQLMMQIIDDCTAASADQQVPDSTTHPSLTMIEKQKISLATTLKNIFDTVSEKGVVLELLNNWTEINFCLPINAHNLPFESELRITEADIERCIELLRPYHAMLLLVDSSELISQLPIDSSPALIRILRVTSPLKNLQELAADSDLELSQVFKLVSHLVYWAKATIIYPLCEPNVYVLSPNAPTSVKSDLVRKFSEDFNGGCLTELLSEFSWPLQLDEHSKITDDKAKKSEKVKMVIWMLQRRLLMQLHTYFYLKPSYIDGDSSSYKYQRNKPSLSPAGNQKLQSITDSDSSTFYRLSQYFNGNHHLEEIMFYENMSRSELLSILDRFLPMLYKLQAPDPATSYYAKCA